MDLEVAWELERGVSTISCLDGGVKGSLREGGEGLGGWMEVGGKRGIYISLGRLDGRSLASWLAGTELRGSP